ncbi:hypothetical protein PHSY_006664 [Pseudozyma hubeiensis SY62]|uniref:SAM domain-containing protein n=1 Tax=Pseudozyma hubeiensis (strain SY62) TaxID=1305764 RepID=R9PCU3_PSEHS|nr:hypothetical protein PHSY_006664 [Pseudozyma hubeiensis SY62]GAC99067.1 hypothetical protein PHSY_006664 [Pseudozyma hubeiensis SY62]
MGSDDPPAISTPSRPRYSLASKRSGTFTTLANATPNVAGFSPGGQVFEGYSYLSRSTSMSTSTRSRPKGLQSRPSDVLTSPPAAASAKMVTSPSSPMIPRAAMSPVSSPSANAFDLPQRSKTVHRMPSSISTPELHSISIIPPRSDSEAERLAEAVANLPLNPKTWLPSQVALYLTHVLGLVPRPVVEDVTAYVRSSRMGGRAFLRLSEKDLERQGLNLKWRKLMIEAVRKLRRDALRGRIWGYESGSLRWPKSSQDLEREEAEDDEGDEPEGGDAAGQDGVMRNSKATSKLTLKRMRDSRKVRGMIQAFQTSPEKQDVPLASLSIDAPFGHGYVRDQAQHILSEAEEKKHSLRRPLRPRRSTADFPWLENAFGTKQEDIESLLANLTDQEAQQLANELGMEDLNDTEAVSRALQTCSPRREGSGDSVEDDVMQMPELTRHASADSTSVEGDSSLSECSATESELDDDCESRDADRKPRYGVLDEDVIRAILAGEELPAEAEEAEPVSASTSSQLSRSHTTASIVRPSRPYRASQYTDDELAALDHKGFHTRTESSRELVEALMSSGQAVGDRGAEPEFGTARLRSAADKTLDAPPIPNFEPASSETQQQSIAAEAANAVDEYIFTLPDAPLRSRTNSVRRTVGSKATFGSRRGKAVLSLLNSDADNSELFSSLPGASSLRKNVGATAEDEEGWGGTLGRTSNRKGLTGVFDVQPPSAMRRSGLERVASEAEVEAVQAKADEKVAEEEVAEAPVDRYEETVLSEEGAEGGMSRRASVEERLSSLFSEGLEVSATEDVEVGPAATEAHAPEEKHKEEEALLSAMIEEAAAPDSAEPTADSSFRADDDTPSGEAAEAYLAVESEELPIVEATMDALDEDTMEANVESTAPVPEHEQINVDLAAAETSALISVDALSGTASVEPFEIVSAPTPPPSQPQLLVPLTVLEPHPSGTGSIKKRSMVLVDRKRFESLARRMTHLEAQLDTIDRSSSSTVKGSEGLKGMFESPESADEDTVEDGDAVLEEILAATSATSVATEKQTAIQPLEIDESCSSVPSSPKSGWRSLINPSSWASYLSSLNPYYSQPSQSDSAEEEEDSLNLYALLGRPESDHEKHLLSIGAIPAYMLGLGAGVGFVLVKEVLGGRH